MSLSNVFASESRLLSPVLPDSEVCNKYVYYNGILGGGGLLSL
jgi:hypothetical protein